MPSGRGSRPANTDETSPDQVDGIGNNGTNNCLYLTVSDRRTRARGGYEAAGGASGKAGYLDNSVD